MAKKITPTDRMAAEMRAGCAWEARVRRAVLRRLEQPIKLAGAVVEKEDKAAQASREKLSGYATEEEANDAYGWDIITEDEYKEVVRILRGEAEGPKEKTEAQAVLETLREFASKIEHETSSFEWEALTPEEQEKARADGEAFKAQLHAAAAGARRNKGVVENDED